MKTSTMTEQFLTGDIWGEANKLLTKNTSKTACIAYVTSEKLKLTKGDILICDASAYAIKYGQTSAKTLDYYFKKGIKLFSHIQLHSKLLLTDNLLIIGSANLSQSSAEKLTESAIITYDASLISQAKAFCHNLKEEASLLTKQNIDSLAKIKIIKRPFKPIKASKIRQKEFSSNYWFVPLHPLPDNTYRKIEAHMKRTSKLISQKENIDPDNIGYIRLPATTNFSSSSKEGDQIIIKFYQNKKRTFVFPPSTILKKQMVGGFMEFYHDIKNSEERKVSWTNFLFSLKSHLIEEKFSIKTKSISESLISKLIPVWE